MSELSFRQEPKGDCRWPLRRLDPRARLLAAVVFSLLVAVSNRFSVLGLALAVAIALAACAGWSPRALLKRLAPLNMFMIMMAALVPLTAGGAPWVELGPLGFSREGLLLAARVALKANAIVAALAALLGTLDIVTIGHALHHLRLPDKLIHLLLFAARYVDLLRREYHRLAAAMKVRAFRPRMDRHTYRMYGYLVGMLLVRSLDRSERVLAAMRCRGFSGRFYLLDHFAFSRADTLFALAAAGALGLLACLEWL